MLTGLAFFLLAAGTASPAPSAACDRDPAIVKEVAPEIDAQALKAVYGSHDATIAVTVDAAGEVISAKVYQSSGESFLDAAAVDAAKRSTYAPGQTNCIPSTGTFAVQYSFAGTAKAPCPREALVVSLALTNDLDRIIGDAPIAVGVTVGADGKLVEARIVRSSGMLEPDRAALKTAILSTYVPKLIAVPVRRQATAGQTASETATECRAVTGTYLIQFNGGN